MQDAAYFRAIDEEMENGGREALMWEMLHFDLTSTNIRQIPETMAGFEQKLETMTPEQKWWMNSYRPDNFPSDATCPGARRRRQFTRTDLTRSRSGASATSRCRQRSAFCAGTPRSRGTG